MQENALRSQKLQQFFAKSNIYQNTSMQQIERQKLTISNESKIVKEISQIEEETKPEMIRPYQNEFDRDMCTYSDIMLDLMAKPLIQPMLQLNIVSKPEINQRIHSVSHQIHRDLDQAIKRSENILIEKQYASIRPGDSNEKIYNEKFLNQLRQQNKKTSINQNQKLQFSKEKSEPQTIKYESTSPQRKFDKEFDFRSMNKKSIKDHMEQIRLPTKISDIHSIGITQEDQQAVDDTFIMHPQSSNYDTVNEKINFESIISIAGGQIDEYAISELVKNVQIAKRNKQIKVVVDHDRIIEEMDSSLDNLVDKQISARPQQQDHSIQMSNKELLLPKVQTTLSGIRLAKQQYFMGNTEDKQQFKLILKNHLNDLLATIMVNYPPQLGINEAINYLLSLKKNELATPIDGVTKLELLYIFLSEYKLFQGLDQKTIRKQPQQMILRENKGYMKPTKATTLKKQRK